MLKDGRFIFDSYGKKNAYNFPEGYLFIQNSPTQLQAFGSDVCQ